MPLFSLQKIGSLASARQTYLRGVSGYNAGWVREYAATVAADGSELVMATVLAAGTEYHVRVVLDPRGETAHPTCDCGRDGAPACKHAVAVLVYKYYKDMIDSQAAVSPSPRVGQTDEAACRLIDRYLSAESAHIAAEGASPTVALVPVLLFGGVRPTVRFLLGDDKLYMVKNPMQLARRIAAGETASYGKHLTLLHHRNSFRPACRPLVDFLLDYSSEHFSAAGDGETLSLSPTALDRFFDAASGAAVRVHTGAGELPVSLTDGNPPLGVTVERHGTSLCFGGDAPPFACGMRATYVLWGNTLYRTTASFTRRVTAWLQALSRQPAGLVVAPAEAGAFCAGVLATVEPFVRLGGDTAALLPYRPRPPQVAVYLDAPADNTVTAAVKFLYGEETVDAFIDPPSVAAAWRDPLGELRVKTAVRGWLPVLREDSGLLELTGDDERLFAFVTDGVEALRRLGAVYATDAFERLTASPPARLSVGMSLAGDWLQLTLDTGDLPVGELDGIISGYRAGRGYHRLKSGRFVRLEDGALATLAELADTLGLSRQELRTGCLSLPKYRAFVLERLFAERAGVTLSRDEAVRTLARRLQEAGQREFPLPTGLRGTLRGYQVTGYRWLRTMEELGLGGILADDMGLGKTVQVIALLLAAKERGAAQHPSLVVCPTSVVLGWERELARFAPGLRVLCVGGDAATRRALLSRAGEADVLITSYDLLKRDVEAYADLTFHYHILDEAQYIKNSTTQNARAVKLVRAAQRFALTGTPMENRLAELWSIMDFLLPGLLFSYAKFRTRFEQPMLRGQDVHAAHRLRQTVAPFVLRRLKGEVLTELPPKTERVLPATMDTAQRQVYAATVQELRGMLRGGGRLSGQSRMTVLALLTRLRQICCDPRLCCEGYTGASGKLEACVELLREAADSGHKVLLFSQFTSMLALVQQRLETEGIDCYLLQGSTPSAERARLVDAFNADKTPVFLISLKAGGTGLNLTGADMVIHYDPWWNLSVENQATDRAYRIGQTRPVQVVRLIARDTVEERILRLQEDKRRLAESVVGATGPTIESLSAEQLLALLQ